MAPLNAGAWAVKEEDKAQRDPDKTGDYEMQWKEKKTEDGKLSELLKKENYVKSE